MLRVRLTTIFSFVDVTLEVWEGTWHVWHLSAGLVPEGKRAIDRIGAFIRSTQSGYPIRCRQRGEQFAGSIGEGVRPGKRLLIRGVSRSRLTDRPEWRRTTWAWTGQPAHQVLARSS